MQEQGCPGVGLPSAPRNRERPGHGRAREGGDKGAQEAGHHLRQLSVAILGEGEGSREGGGALPCVQGEGEVSPRWGTREAALLTQQSMATED